MRIVIDIPDLDYFDIKHGYADNYQRERLVESVKRSIAIPKNHGRLIDAEQLMNYCQNQIDGHKYADCNVIARCPIVLDAEVEHDG